MTAPVLPTDTGKLGPGEFTIGEVASPIDVSCYLNNARVQNTTTKGDDTTKLCGAVRAGKTEYAWEITGNLDVDAGNASGLLALSWEEKGTVVPFSYTPNSELGTEVSGTLVLDPLSFGADAYGDDLTSDFTWSIVGDPTLTFAPVIP